MKYLDKLINFIFSVVILLLSIIVIMVSTGLMEYDVIDNYMRINIFGEESNTTTCIVSIVTLLAALKTTIFLSITNKKKKSVIMVDTNHGKIQIAQETIESTAKSVVKSYEEIRDVQVRMLKSKKGVNVYMALLVLPNTNIIELSAKVQDEVKVAIEQSTGVRVNNVDIKIKNITDTHKIKAKETIKKEKATKSEVVNDITPEVNEIKDSENIIIEESLADIIEQSNEGSNENK